MVKTRSHAYAGFWIRFAACLIDLVILAVLAGLLFGNQCSNVFYCDATSYGYYGWQNIIPLAYLLGFWIWKSATPGKLLFKLQIHGPDGKVLTPQTAVLRFLGYLVNALTLGIGFLWIVWDKEKQGLHDKIAKTHVVQMN